MNASVNGPADEVGVMPLEITRAHRVPGQYPLPETRGKPLNLGLDGLDHRSGKTVRYMAISPCGVLAFRRASRVKQTRLREDYKRSGLHFPAPHGAFRSGNLFQVSTQVNSSGGRALQGTPRNGAIKGPIHFVDSGAVAVAFQAATERLRESLTRDGQELLRSDV